MLAWMEEMLDKLGQALVALLPLSPFTDIINSLEQMPFLGYINWFIPISEMIAVAGVWLVAIGVYYAYSVIARWIKLIG